MSFFWGSLELGPARLNREKLRYRPMHLWTESSVLPCPAPLAAWKGTLGVRGGGGAAGG